MFYTMSSVRKQNYSSLWRVSELYLLYEIIEEDCLEKLSVILSNLKLMYALQYMFIIFCT